MRPRDKKKEQAVVDAAIQLINQYGIEGLSMSKLAKLAGVSPATLYIYYANKDDLLNQLFVKVRREFAQAIFAGFDPQMDFTQGFQLLWENHYRFAREHSDAFWFLEQSANSVAVREMDPKQESRWLAPMDMFLHFGHEAGVFKDLNLMMFRAFAFAPILQLVKAELRTGTALTDHDLAAARQLSWGVIAA
ncbi:MAG: TetR/AcrR family transcriptional regulator [Bacteroidota bacterium]